LVDYKPPPGTEFYLSPSTFVTNAQAILEKQNKLKDVNQEDSKGNQDSEKEDSSPEEEKASDENKDSKTENAETENTTKESDKLEGNEVEEKKETDQDQKEKKESPENGESIENGKPGSNNPTEEEIKNNKKLSEDVINLILNKPETNRIVDTETGKNATIINLLSDEKVNAINLLEVLRYVEEKTNELLVFNYMTHLPKRKDTSDGDIKATEKMFLSTEAVADHNVTLLGPGPEAPITNLNVKIPER